MSCMPCADMDLNNNAHNTAQFAADPNDHAHDKQSDLCSPFCICNCCGLQVLNNVAAIKCDFLVLNTLIKCPLPNYTSVFSSNFYGSIWQPPQIV